MDPNPWVFPLLKSLLYHKKGQKSRAPFFKVHHGYNLRIWYIDLQLVLILQGSPLLLPLFSVFPSRLPKSYLFGEQNQTWTNGAMPGATVLICPINF